MKGSAIKIAGFFVMVLLLAGLCLILFSAKPEQFQTIRRSDGSTLTLIGVTYGTNHTMIWGKPYQRSFYKMLPQNFKSLSGATVARFTTSQTNMPVFWLLDSRVQTNSRVFVTGMAARPGFMTNFAQGNQTGIRPGAVLKSSTFASRLSGIVGGPGPNSAFRILDEYGCEHEPNGYSSGSSFGGRDGTLSHYKFDAADPHCKIIGICVYDAASGSNEIGRFLVPGAVMKSLPATAKESLPPPQQDGDMTFQLTSLVTGLPAEPFSFGRFSSGKTNNAPVFTRATLHITKSGAPTTEWQPARVIITDANGKMVPVGWIPSMLARQGGDDVIDFQGFLDPTNGPYKIRAEFIHRTGFSSNELMTFTNVPFPASSNSLSLTNVTAEVSGHRLTLETFYGTFSERPPLRFSASQPVVQARMEPADEATHLQMVTILDENHDPLPAWGVVPKARGETYFSLAPNTHARSATLTFAVHQSRFAEFEAIPTVLSTNPVVVQK